MSVVDGIVSDKINRELTNAIFEASKRQAVYAYNVANSSTPGFTPIRFEDELIKAQEVFGQESQQFNIEEEMAKMSQNSLKHSALAKIYSTRLSILRKVVTMGKGG